MTPKLKIDIATWSREYGSDGFDYGTDVIFTYKNNYYRYKSYSYELCVEKFLSEIFGLTGFDSKSDVAEVLEYLFDCRIDRRWYEKNAR